jgi:hypothetical protein
LEFVAGILRVSERPHKTEECGTNVTPDLILIPCVSNWRDDMAEPPDEIPEFPLGERELEKVNPRVSTLVRRRLVLAKMADHHKWTAMTAETTRAFARVLVQAADHIDKFGRD